MPATLDITEGVKPNADAVHPQDYGIFGDLAAPAEDAPLSEKAATSLIGGGTAEAPAFQIVGGNFSEVPRAIAGHLNTDFGPFSDLTKDESMPQIDNLNQEFGMFQDVASAFTPVPETQKAVAEAAAPSYLQMGQDFGRAVNHAVFGPFMDVLSKDAQATLLSVGETADKAKSALDVAVPGLVDQATESPFPGTHLVAAPAGPDAGLLERGRAYGRRVNAGIVNWATGLVESGTSPAMLTGIVAAGIPAASRAISGAFAAQMGASIPSAIERFKAAPNGSQEQIEAALGMAAVMGFTGGAAGHALRGETPALPQAREEVTTTTEPVAVDQTAATEPLATPVEDTVPPLETPVSQPPSADASATSTSQAPVEVPLSSESSVPVENPSPEPATVTVEGNTYFGATPRPAEVAPEQSASVPVMITKAMEAELRSRGVTEEQLYKMTPQEANDILKKPAETAPTKAEPTLSAENDLAEEKQLKIHDSLLGILKNCIGK